MSSLLTLIMPNGNRGDVLHGTVVYDEIEDVGVGGSSAFSLALTENLLTCLFQRSDGNRLDEQS